MTVKGVKVGPLSVGWHLKGAWGSWVNIDSKPGIKIKVDAFVKDQTIHGVKKLILNNMRQEPSSINQQVVMKLFRAMNVPASRTGYAHLTINGIDFGVYTNIESLDKISLARWYLNTKHLYKGGVPYHWADLIPDQAWALQVETGSLTNRDDLTPFLNANISDNWWTEIQKYADMQEMTREWAVEYVLGHWDGYANNGNNYFLHVDKSGKFTMLPWGVDQGLNGPMDYHYPNKLMPQRCLQDANCQAMYYQAIADTAAAITSLDLTGFADKVSANVNKWILKNPPNRSFYSYNDAVAYQTGAKFNLANSASWPFNSYITNGISEVGWSDSGLSQATIAGTVVKPVGLSLDLGVIQVSSGTTSVVVSPVTRQPSTAVVVTGSTNLKVGLNTISIKVTSPNGKNVRTYTAKVNVPNVIVKTLAVSFSSNGALTTASVTAIKNFAATIKTLKVLSIDLASNGIESQRKTLLAKVVSELKKNGLGPLTTQTTTLNRSLKTTNATATLRCTN